MFCRTFFFRSFAERKLINNKISVSCPKTLQAPNTEQRSNTKYLCNHWENHTHSFREKDNSLTRCHIRLCLTLSREPVSIRSNRTGMEKFWSGLNSQTLWRHLHRQSAASSVSPFKQRTCCSIRPPHTPADSLELYPQSGSLRARPSSGPVLSPGSRHRPEADTLPGPGTDSVDLQVQRRISFQTDQKISVPQRRVIHCSVPHHLCHVPTDLCRCLSPRCKSAARPEQRRAATSGGPGLGHPSAGALFSERPGTGPGGSDGTGDKGDAGERRMCSWWTCSPGPQDVVCRRRMSPWSKFEDLLWL